MFNLEHFGVVAFNHLDTGFAFFFAGVSAYFSDITKKIEEHITMQLSGPVGFDTRINLEHFAFNPLIEDLFSILLTRAC